MYYTYTCTSLVHARSETTASSYTIQHQHTQAAHKTAHCACLPLHKAAVGSKQLAPDNKQRYPATLQSNVREALLLLASEHQHHTSNIATPKPPPEAKAHALYGPVRGTAVSGEGHCCIGCFHALPSKPVVAQQLTRKPLLHPDIATGTTKHSSTTALNNCNLSVNSTMAVMSKSADCAPSSATC